MPGRDDRTLTQRELNRAMLARQLLLDRARVPVTRALEQIGGVQAQYAPSMYVGLWTRLEGFERAALTRALERRTVVQGTLMRSTIHLVSARDYWPLAIAIRQTRRDWWLRTHPGQASAREITAAATRARERLAGGPLRRADLDALAGAAGVGGLGLWLDMVRVPPSGTWERRRADLFAAAEDWLGPPDVAHDDALVHLVRRYLGAFGPATRNDLADWAGLPLPAVAAVLERLRVRRFRDEAGKELLDLPRAPLPDPDAPAPVRLLPVWDAMLLVHARRTGVLPEEHRSKVFNPRTPHSVNTFLVDGVVAGTWAYEKGKLRLDPFSPIDRRTRREVDEEAARLAAFHA